ncbi:trypsin-like peptidase domain-containing protein [Candidatus Poriferisocius sp.]|uniref:trypsin-like peptidase domain-containing protein n=1 Tax=Candidatus Poriferisocius sp. TaxID=3101276 RepID=UPI003B022429
MVAAISVFAAPAATAQTVEDVRQRDQLIANQENLLNTYRCLFGVDVDVVPGQCPNPDLVAPGVAPPNPSQNDLDVRDGLIQSQEALLNVYRCRFDVDTQIVPGGCVDGAPAPQPGEDSQPDGGALTAAQIYERTAPSVPLIRTASGSGSGILIEGGYVVTNYHVVGFHETARVVFPDGTEFEDVPVIGYDFMADIAVLGPIEFHAAALELADGEALAPGSDLFLVGYPAEYEQFPQASITRGILSRFRQWDTYDLTLIQTDAAIAGGQSGGALVNERGQVVGISTWSFSAAGFGVATSAADVAVIVEGLIASGPSADPDDDRTLSDAVGDFAFEVDATFAQALTFHGQAGTTVTITIDGEADGILLVTDAIGVLVEVDETETSEETAVFEIPEDATYFVVVDSWANDSGDYTFDLTSSVRLQPYADPDDSQEAIDASGWAQGEWAATFGLFDFYSDVDEYVLVLSEGATYSVSTDSIFADTDIAIIAPDGEVLYDDDSGPSTVFDNPYNAMIEFTATSTGEYFVLVGEVNGERGDGYAILVQRLA